jgi:hypothetical protein
METCMANLNMNAQMEREPEKIPEIRPPGLPSVPERAAPHPEIQPQRSPQIHPDQPPMEIPAVPGQPFQEPEISPPEINPR